jgi:hypothetical protein
MIAIEVKKGQKNSQYAEIQKVLGTDYDLEGPLAIFVHPR